MLLKNMRTNGRRVIGATLKSSKKETTKMLIFVYKLILFVINMNCLGLLPRKSEGVII